MPDLPTGTVTFLFTDIEGSTNLARTLGDRWPDVLEEHHGILRSAIRQHKGLDLRTEGDAFFAVFTSAPDAVAATADAQRALAAHRWPPDGPVRVRMGMHTGEGRLGGEEYVGLDVHLAARIAAAGHGGQVLVSDATRALVADKVPEGVTLRDLGAHRLKDFDDPQPLHQLLIDGLPDDFPPLKTLTVRTNLPVPLTAFVGRDDELAALDAILDRARLVTLVGPGGTGKTRLALEAAARRADRHRDGVFFVDLSSIRDPEQVPSTLVKGIGLKQQPGRPALQTALEHLADRRTLLLLDNFEQVVGAAPFVAETLQAALHAHIVVTSRIHLGLAGEQEFPVPPLGVPAAGGELEAVADNEAVTLFVDRARAVRASFELTKDNAPAVAEICARLDGLPLAIELAAAQLRVLSPKELLDRLERRLPLRTGGPNVPERQRTLQSTIEWSYDLLDDEYRTFFARQGVFVGGASFAAVDAVCNPEGELGVDTLDALDSLVDQSLIRREESPEGSRYVMLEVIRDYAIQRLRAEFDLDETESRSAEFFAALAEEWGPRVRSAQSIAAASILGLDHGNLRAAMDWALREDRADVGLRICGALWMFWVEHGPLAEGRRLTEALLRVPSAAPRDALRAASLDALGAVAYWEGDYDDADRAYADAVAIYREIGDPASTARALNAMGYVAGARGDPSSALSQVEEALELARGAGLRYEAAEALGLMGLALSYQGRLEEALVATRESLESFDAQDVPYWRNQMKSRLGALYLRMGRLDEAERNLREALAETEFLSGAIGIGATITLLAGLAAARGDHERALRLVGFSEAISERMGSFPPLGLVSQVSDLVATARAALDEDTQQRLVEEGKAMSQEDALAYVWGTPP